MRGFRKRTAPPPARPAREGREFLDVTALEGPTILRADGTYAALIAVEGEFFSLLAVEEQDQRLGAYKEWLTSIPEGWPIQITIMVEPAHLDGYLEEMRQAAGRAGDGPRAVLAEEQAALAVELAGQALVETTYVTATGRTAAEALDRANVLLKGLRDHGFHSALCDQERLGLLLQRAYGHDPVPLDQVLGGWATAVGRLPDKTPDRTIPRPTLKLRRKTADALQVAPPPAVDVIGPNLPRLADLLMPSAVEEMPGYVSLGGTYAASLVAVAYPDQGVNGWLERLLHFTHGAVRRRITWHLHPIQQAVALNEINRKLRDLDANARGALKRGLRPDVDTENALADGEELRQAIGTGQERLFDATLFVTLMSEDLQELQDAVSALRVSAAGYSLVLRPTWLEEGPAFRSSLPLGLTTFRRVIPLSSWPIASMFPFTAGEVLDAHGDLWGENLATGNAVILDPRRTRPGHMVVVAKTQSGKSFLIKVLTTQTLLRGDEDVIILDPSPPIDYERWTGLMGGTYARFSAGSADRINPCEILLPDRIDQMDEEWARPVTAKVAFLTALFGLMAYPHGEMPQEERALLAPVLTDLYTRFGFQDDWASVVDRSELSARPKARRAPTLQDALDAVAATPGLEGLALRVRPFLTGTFPMFNGPTTVDIQRPCVVFNVYGLVQGVADDYVQTVAYAMITEFVRGRLAQSGRRTLVVVDEAHIMFQRKDTALFVAQLYRMAAKLGGRIGLITQGITDLLGDPETGMTVAGQEQARVCLTNTTVTVLLRNDKGSDLHLLQREYGLTDAEVRAVQSAQPGHGILIAGDARAFVHVLAPDTLYRFITTRPDEVEAFAQEGWFTGMAGYGGRSSAQKPARGAEFADRPMRIAAAPPTASAAGD